MEPPGPAPEQVDPAGQPAGVQRYNDWFMMYVFKVGAAGESNGQLCNAA